MLIKICTYKSNILSNYPCNYISKYLIKIIFKSYIIFDIKIGIPINILLNVKNHVKLHTLVSFPSRYWIKEIISSVIRCIGMKAKLIILHTPKEDFKPSYAQYSVGDSNFSGI